MRPVLVPLLLLLFVSACQSEPEPAPAAPAAPAASPPPMAPEPTAAQLPAPAEPDPVAPAEPVELREPIDPDEACGRALVVAYKGAEHADATVTRSKEQALARAVDLRGQAVADPAGFTVLAQGRSDAPSSARRGGIVGTYTRADWPDLHGALRDPLFALKVNQIAAEPVVAPYGYVVLQRCAVEKVHGRHILVRYAGAMRADSEVTRDANEARARATVLRGKLAEGADFAELARTHSEDGSAERGGDLGLLGRGKLALPMEEALFALDPGEVGRVVETDFGFHVVQRMPK